MINFIRKYLVGSWDWSEIADGRMFHDHGQFSFWTKKPSDPVDVLILRIELRRSHAKIVAGTILEDPDGFSPRKKKLFDPGNVPIIGLMLDKDRCLTSNHKNVHRPKKS